MLPHLHGPLPATPGPFLALDHHAHKVWTAAPWSAAVLAARDLDDNCRLAELKWFASCHIPSDPFRVTGWMHLSANQVAFKLLVTWKVYFWPRWSVLPYPAFGVLDHDPHSFDQYSVPRPS